jgi:hypothetical protein
MHMLPSARILSAFLGLGFLIAPFLVAYSFAIAVEPSRPVSLRHLTPFIGFGCALSAGYFALALFARGILVSTFYRKFVAVLLALPTVMSTYLLVATHSSAVAIFFAIVTASTLFLASAFLWPAWLQRSNISLNPDA